MIKSFYLDEDTIIMLSSIKAMLKNDSEKGLFVSSSNVVRMALSHYYDYLKSRKTMFK